MTSHAVTSPSDDPNDRRQAASLAVGIASAVTTAALAVIGALAVIVTYVAGKYEHLTWFYVLASVSAALLVCAIIVGTQGIAQITKKGYQGSWSPSTEGHLFNKQSNITMAALAFLAAAVIVGFSAPLQPPPEPAAVSATQTEIARLKHRLARDEMTLQSLRQRVVHSSRGG